MFQVLIDLQTLLYNFMGFDTFDMGHKPYTASIMLKLRIIEPSI
jgi:hypothetical protein